MTTLSPELLEMLVCPACHSKLQQENEELACSGCGLVYPIEDGIPIMLIGRAKRRD
ncbi:MAG: Trm112 family protein [Acidobacteriaceae bacterium]